MTDFQLILFVNNYFLMSLHLGQQRHVDFHQKLILLAALLTLTSPPPSILCTATTMTMTTTMMMMLSSSHLHTVEPFFGFDEVSSLWKWLSAYVLDAIPNSTALNGINPRKKKDITLDPWETLKFSIAKKK